MSDDGIIQSNSEVRVAESLIEENPADLAELKTLKSLDIDIEQVEYLQTIGQGWAFPLQKFMDELQLLEVLHMKTLTDNIGKRHLFSVPITQHCTKE